MTVSVGFLEVSVLGGRFPNCLIKNLLITGIAIFLMALIGLNIAFEPNPKFTQWFVVWSRIYLLNKLVL